MASSKHGVGEGGNSLQQFPKAWRQHKKKGPADKVQNQRDGHQNLLWTVWHIRCQTRMWPDLPNGWKTICFQIVTCHSTSAINTAFGSHQTGHGGFTQMTKHVQRSAVVKTGCFPQWHVVKRFPLNNNNSFKNQSNFLIPFCKCLRWIFRRPHMTAKPANGFFLRQEEKSLPAQDQSVYHNSLIFWTMPAVVDHRRRGWFAHGGQV